MRVLIILALFVASCATPIDGALVEKADKLEIIFYNNGDTLTQTVTDKSLLKDFKKNIRGKFENVACQPTGQINFYVKDAVIYAVGFSTPATGAADSCSYLTLRGMGWKLMYRTGRYLDEEYYQLRTNAK